MVNVWKEICNEPLKEKKKIPGIKANASLGFPFDSLVLQWAPILTWAMGHGQRARHDFQVNE